MIRNEHIKEIQMLLGDDTFGDYVRIRLSNPKNIYDYENLELKKFKLNSGYRINDADIVLPVFLGYSILSKESRFLLPNEVEIYLQNRFYYLGRYPVGSTDFQGKTLKEVLEFFKKIFKLSDEEFILEVPEKFLNKQIPVYDGTGISYLDFLKKVCEAFNLFIWWDYEGKLKVRFRDIPQESSFIIKKNKSIIQTETRPFKRATLIQVFGRRLEYWEQTSPIQVIGSYPHRSLDHAKLGNSVLYVNAQQFTLHYSTKPSWATEVILSPNFAQCGYKSGPLYEYRFLLIEQDYCIIEIRVIDKELYECCLKNSNPEIYNQIFFDISLLGYRIRNEEKYSRVYSEYRDLELEAKYGGRIEKRIDNELIPDRETSDAILEFEKKLNEIVAYEVQIEIPLNPLIERYDRITIEGEFDCFITSIEHSYEAYSGKSKTVLRGYIL